MQNYREFFTFHQLETIKDMLDELQASDLPRRIKSLSEYLRDGYKYAANVNDPRVQKWDITAHVDLIHTLCMMSADMLKVEEEHGWILKMPDGQMLALNPFFDFCDSLTEPEWVDLVDNLAELKEVMRNYLNETNVWQFKECGDTLTRLHFFFHRLNLLIQS